jgi:hypothetical protein
VSFLLDCLAIVEPGYEAPRAQVTFEASQPRVAVAHNLCKTCGVDEKRTGRSECEECIAASESGAKERENRRRACREAHQRRVEHRASMAKPQRGAPMTAYARREDALMDAAVARWRETKSKTCACGRALPCSRRMCRDG